MIAQTYNRSQHNQAVKTVQVQAVVILAQEDNIIRWVSEYTFLKH